MRLRYSVPASAVLLITFLTAGATLRGQQLELPLERALTPDGRVASQPVATRLDVRGWHMRLDRDGAPRFARSTASTSPRFRSGVPDDLHWQSIGDLDGSFVWVYDAAVAGDDLYVVGQFSTLDGVEVNNVARWDGERWSPLGSGVDGWAMSIAIDGDDVFVGGSIDGAGDATLNGIARWDGARWHPLGVAGSGVLGAVLEIVPLNDRVYAGGSFAVAINDAEASDYLVVEGIAAWDRTTGLWEALGSPGAEGVDGTVYAIEQVGETVYVGGRFDTAGSVPASALAAFDRTTSAWSAIADAAIAENEAGSEPIVTSMLRDGQRLYVSGRFDTVDGVVAHNIARLDIATGAWSVVAGPTASTVVSDMQMHDGAIHALSYDGRVTAVIRLADADWTTVDTLAGINALAADADDLFVVGELVREGKRRFVLERDGDGWSAIDGRFVGGPSFTINAVVADDRDIFVAGYFTRIDTVSASGIARYDRASGTWHRLGDTAANGVDGVALALHLVDDRLYVGGRFDTAGSIPAHNVAVWLRSTRTWTSLPAAGGNGVGGSVDAIASTPTIVYFGGDFDSVGTIESFGVAYWADDNGVLLPLEFDLPQGVTGVDVDALATDASGIYGAGSITFTLGSGVGVMHRANGVTAILTPGGLDGHVGAMALYKGDLVIGGAFSQVEGVPASGLARWDGTRWHALGSDVAEGVDGVVTALTVAGGRLFVGGNFSTAAGVAARNVAVWNGSTFEPLGSGVNGPASSMATASDGVIVAGMFSVAGDKTAIQLALWNQLVGSAPVDAAITALTPRVVPNPASSDASITFAIPVGADVTLTLVDPLGREIATILDARLPAGPHRIAWSPQSLSEGTYLLRLHAGDRVVTSLVGVTR